MSNPAARPAVPSTQEHAPERHGPAAHTPEAQKEDEPCPPTMSLPGELLAEIDRKMRAAPAPPPRVVRTAAKPRTVVMANRPVPTKTVPLGSIAAAVRQRPRG